MEDPFQKPFLDRFVARRYRASMAIVAFVLIVCTAMLTRFGIRAVRHFWGVINTLSPGSMDWVFALILHAGVLIGLCVMLGALVYSAGICVKGIFKGKP